MLAKSHPHSVHSCISDQFQDQFFQLSFNWFIHHRLSQWKSFWVLKRLQLGFGVTSVDAWESDTSARQAANYNPT